MSTLRMGALALACFAAPCAWSADITGNPISDGWTQQGNSLAVGTFARSGGGSPENALNFDIYARTYSIEAGSNLLYSPNWQVGDTVLGLGIVSLSAYDITVSPMLKFGGATSMFKADSNGTPAPADGVVDLSGGSGGDGSVLIRVTGAYNRNGSGSLAGDLITPANNGAALAPNVMGYYDGGYVDLSGNAAANDAARFVTLFNTTGRDTVTSWEGLLNISALARQGVTFSDLPTIGAASVVSFMRSTGADGTEAIALTSAVPEPATCLMALSGLGVLLIAARRRRSTADSVAAG